MPNIGEVKTGKQLGKPANNGAKYIWDACPLCGFERWIRFLKGKPSSSRCWHHTNRNNFKPLPSPGGTSENPVVGDIRRGQEIGKKSKDWYVYQLCKDCQVGRWVRHERATLNCRCGKCNALLQSELYPRPKGEASAKWKGYKRHDRFGYVILYVDENDFFASMASPRHYVGEHRYIMAKSLGRCLQEWEVVHHKNGVKDDNRIENLELKTHGQHLLDHSLGYRDGYSKGLIDGRDKQIKELKLEIEKLKSMVASYG